MTDDISKTIDEIIERHKGTLDLLAKDDGPELKPCPFCGNTNLYLYYYDVDDRCNPFDPCVRCDSCGTVLKFRYSAGHNPDDIMRVWNRRAKE